MQKFKTLDEITQITSLLGAKPEIDNKVQYYKSVIQASINLIEEINTKLLTETDTYIKSKLELEKIETENALHYSKQYFEIWLDRTRDYDVKYAEILRDCNENYDTIISEGNVVKEHNPILQMIMGEHSKIENVEDKVRVEYYLCVRQAVENYKNHHKIKIDTILVPEKKSELSVVK